MGLAKERRPLFAPSEKVHLVKVSTTGTTIGNIGQFVLESTSTGGSVFVTINPPAFGREVLVSCYSVGSTSSHLYLDTTGETFDKAGNDRINFTTDDAVQLLGYSTSTWVVTASHGSPVLGSTS
jgi:hypothetical protein